MWKYIVVFLCLFLSMWNIWVFAQEEQEAPICPNYSPSIEGNAYLVVNAAQDFSVVWLEEASEKPDHTYTLYSWDAVILTSENDIFTHAFETKGSYRLVHELIYWEIDCTYTSERTIQVFTDMIIYLWPPSDEISLGRDSMSTNDRYLHEISVDESIATLWEPFTALLLDNAYYIQHAKTLLVDGDLVWPLFERLTTLQQLAGITLNSDLYVLASINQSAFRRMIATYRDLLWVDKMYVVWKQYVGSLMTSLLLNKNTQGQSFVKTYNVWLASSNKMMIVSYFVDYLLYHDFPLWALLFILILPVLVLIISIFRQVIGVSVFGVFYPVLFAFSLHILWIAPTLLFLVWAFLTTLIVWYFTKRIYLLYSAKVSLLVVVYCLVTLFLLRLTNSYAILEIDYSLFQNYYFLFPYVILLLVGNRIFTEQFYLFDAGWWTWLLEFSVISGIIYRCISSPLLQNTILWFPEIALICLFVIIIVWRFTWLQLLEYVRFMPLIKHYFEEEEE